MYIKVSFPEFSEENRKAVIDYYNNRKQKIFNCKCRR